MKVWIAAATRSTKMMMSSVLFDVPLLDAPAPRKNAIVTTVVTETAAPATKAAELRRQFSLVARKIALRICGPAIITNASGMTLARLTLVRLLGSCPAVCRRASSVG
jgi:hypothetical protein